MKRIMQDIVSAIIYHIVFVAVLGGLAMFVWNSGAVNLLPDRLSNITYTVSLAIVTGIYVIDLFIKSYINRIMAYQKQKQLIDLMFGKTDDKKDRRKRRWK